MQYVVQDTSLLGHDAVSVGESSTYRPYSHNDIASHSRRLAT